MGLDHCVDVMMQAGDGGSLLDVRCWLRPPCSLACQLRATYVPRPSATAASSEACLHSMMKGFNRAVGAQALGVYACPVSTGSVQSAPQYPAAKTWYDAYVSILMVGDSWEVHSNLTFNCRTLRTPLAHRIPPCCEPTQAFGQSLALRYHQGCT